jgi:hypothetical protein
MELLLGEGNARWERCEMPVNVRDAVVRPEAEDVEPFRREGDRDRTTEPIDPALKGQVLVFGEVTDDLSPMRDRGEQGPAAQGRVLRRNAMQSSSLKMTCSPEASRMRSQMKHRPRRLSSRSCWAYETASIDRFTARP